MEEVRKIKCIKFNYETNSFEPNEFTNEVTELKQWIELYIKVELNKYKIYNENFGMDFSDLLGYRLPRSVIVSEIIRRLKRGIINGANHVNDVRDFTFDKGTFTFTVITDLGDEVIIHV